MASRTDIGGPLRDEQQSYDRIIRRLYGRYGEYATSRIREATVSLNPRSPFLRFGAWKRFIVYLNGEPVAHAAAIVDARLPEPVGLLGFLEAVDEPSFREAVESAREWLRDRGKRIVRGPVNCSVWQTFRCSVPESPAPFYLEPYTKGAYHDWLDAMGFKVVHENVSTLETIDNIPPDLYRASHDSAEARGYRFVVPDAQDFIRYLPALHRLTTEVFSRAWSFVPISYDEFLYQAKDSAGSADYRLYDLVLDAAGSPVAYMFAVPDRYTHEKRAVAKTLAVHPAYQHQGIGCALLYRLWQKMRNYGMREVVYSTMEVGNRRIRTLTRNAPVFRRYYAYELGIE